MAAGSDTITSAAHPPRILARTDVHHEAIVRPARPRAVAAVPIVAACLVVACSSPDAAPAVDDEPAGGSSDAAAEAPGEAEAGAEADAGPTSIAIAAGTGDWTAAEDLTVSGQGDGDLGEIALAHGVGTIQFAGAPAQAYYFVGTPVPLGVDGGADGGLAEEHDYEIVAVQPERLIVTWLTCFKGALAYVYYETTDGLATADSTPASGTCTALAGATHESVAFDPVSFPPPTPPTGFSIAGAAISFDGEHPGHAEFASTDWVLYPFHAIDCTACAASGWWELHSIFADPKTSTACVGILYYLASQPASVELAYLSCLPGLTSPIPNDKLMFAATGVHP